MATIREQVAENFETFGSATGLASAGSLLISGLEPAAQVYDRVIGAVQRLAISSTDQIP